MTHMSLLEKTPAQANGEPAQAVSEAAEPAADEAQPDLSDTNRITVY